MTIDALLRPGSIAVVGASERPSAGRNILVSLDRLGFAGAVYPINPKRDTILGRPCFATLADVPDPIDAVAFCIGNAHLLGAYRQAVAKGVKAAVIYAGGFSESADADAQHLGAAIAGLSREGAIALCGPNCMGALSPALRSTTYLHEVLDPARIAGNVGLVSQSGAICIALASDCRRFGFSHVISSGNEAILTTCDFLEFLIADAETRGGRAVSRIRARTGPLRRPSRCGRRRRQAGRRAESRAQRARPAFDHDPYRRPRRRSSGLFGDRQGASGDRSRHARPNDRGLGSPVRAASGRKASGWRS